MNIKRFNESNGGSKQRISEDIIDTFDILTNYESALDISVFSVFRDLNSLTDIELKEKYDSLSSNKRVQNSKEENFWLDLVEHFNLV